MPNRKFYSAFFDPVFAESYKRMDQIPFFTFLYTIIPELRSLSTKILNYSGGSRGPANWNRFLIAPFKPVLTIVSISLEEYSFIEIT